MIKQIRLYNPFDSSEQDPLLLNETKKIIDFNDSAVQQCIRDLTDTLSHLATIHGCTRSIGLSAPQIGYSLSISAIYTSSSRYILINPKIISHAETQKLFRVGCFSFYQYRALVKCYDKVTVEYFDVNGSRNEITIEDDLALIFQHEIDHLHGILSFERMANKEKDLFIPREKLTTKHVLLKNYGVAFSLRQKIGLVKTQSILQYYSFLFNYSYDFESYIKFAVQKRKELTGILKKYCSTDCKLLEAGCGTSSISIFLSREGYNVECIDNNSDMLLLAQEINRKVKGCAKYTLGDIKRLPYKEHSFEIVYSHGVLEHFNDAQKIEIITEGLRVANIYIISVPTIWDISNNLIGDEILWTVGRWKRFFIKNGYKIIEVKKAFPTTPKLEKLNKSINLFPSGNIIFVIKRK